MSTNNRRTHWIGLVILQLAICVPGIWGKALIVGKADTPCPNAAYSTITAAINAAQPGDLVEVCPALYPEQLLITKPLTLKGIQVQGIDRVLIQPAQMATVGALGFTAVISVVNTSDVTISNVAVDASHNSVTGCSDTVSGIHFFNASGTVDGAAIFGTQLSNPTSCRIFPGNGFGVQADESAGAVGSFKVTVRNTSIHDFNKTGILVRGAGLIADISGNSIVGVGPGSGVAQWGIVLVDGVTGQVMGNNITHGTCGTISILDCFNVRSEGIVLRSIGQGVMVAENVISNVQVGIFVIGFPAEGIVSNVHVIDNLISNVDALSGIHIQGTTSSSFAGNRIFHVGPFTADTSNDEEGCGINDVSGTGSSANTIAGNSINDAYCGVGYVTGDRVEGNSFRNTLYEALNGDSYPDVFPPPVEPGQAPPAAVQPMVAHRRHQP